jgi:hypothetical protein
MPNNQQPIDQDESLQWSGRHRYLKKFRTELVKEYSTPRPVGLSKILVATQIGVPVHDHRRSFWCKSKFVGIARNGSHSRNSEIEQSLRYQKNEKYFLTNLESSLLHKGNDKATQATIDVQTDLILLGYLAQTLSCEYLGSNNEPEYRQSGPKESSGKNLRSLWCYW